MKPTGKEVAIIGFGLRFPGAETVEQYWQNLCDAKETIKFFTDDELLAAGHSKAKISSPNYVKARGVLSHAFDFDAEFFNIPPNEAMVLDPQHRVMLECVWEALESSGYSAKDYQGRIGLFGGVYDEAYRLLIEHSHVKSSIGSLGARISNEKDYAVTRTAYKLGFTGPAVTIQTACSTSLVAVHVATSQLLQEDCDIAIAGAVTVHSEQITGYEFQAGGIYSSDGHCRAFDAKAEGSVSSSGAGFVVLKLLEKALDDSDTIYAVIRGSAINNDGDLRVGYTAPSIQGQVQVIEAALRNAQVSPNDINYVEAHGSGTRLGDPIELRALTQAFQTHTTRLQYCGIGSVKTNIGHTHVASGVAGLIKTALALYHRKIPPQLYYQRSNPAIDFAKTPFYVVNEMIDLSDNAEPILAGVSSFGMGGTNAHIILEEPPRETITRDKNGYYFLPLSARTAAAMKDLRQRLVEHLESQEDVDVGSIGYTLHTGRKHFSHRSIAVCRADKQDAIQALHTQHLENDFRNTESSVIFLFSGLGTHYVNMAYGLYRSIPFFRQTVDNCFDKLENTFGINYQNILYPTGVQQQTNPISSDIDLKKMLSRVSNTSNASKPANELDKAHILHPILFVIEYALARLWMYWGIQPAAMIGYSLGEYVAACIAGVLTLDDALNLVFHRAKIIENAGTGSLLSVPLSVDSIQAYLTDELSVAIVASPKQCVIGGAVNEIDDLHNRLEREGIFSYLLYVNHAVHTPMMTDGAEELAELIRRIQIKEPQIPYVSTLTGDWIRNEDVVNPDYWRQHLCNTILYSDAVEKLLQLASPQFIELGPGNSLISLLPQHEEWASNMPMIVSLRSNYLNKADEELMAEAVGRLWMYGHNINFDTYYDKTQLRRVFVPTYPFERQRFHINDIPVSKPMSKIDTFVYTPTWKQSLATQCVQEDNIPECFVLFTDSFGVGDSFANHLETLSYVVIRVMVGESFKKIDETVFQISPLSQGDFEQLFSMTPDVPLAIVDFWNIGGDKSLETKKSEAFAFTSLLFMARALFQVGISSQIKILIASTDLYNVLGTETLIAEKALLLGPCLVLPVEYPNLVCKSVDFARSETEQAKKQLHEQLLAEIVTQQSDTIVAYRGTKRWIQNYEDLNLNNLQASQTLTRNGVYLITGGLGGIGLSIAKYLVLEQPCTIILLNRSGLPPRETWKAQLAQSDDYTQLYRRIQAVSELEKLGGQIIILEADVSDLHVMETMWERILTKFGRIDGVFHCAGNPSIGLTQFKSMDEIEQTLAPKFRGAQVLAQLFKSNPPQFMVLFSSTIAITGGLGQIDYAAANAYLDSFAELNSQPTRIISINWDGWQKIGMAARLAEQTTEQQKEFVGQTLLNTMQRLPDGRFLFETTINREDDWLFSEHRIAGQLLFPGTAYIEMVYQAFSYIKQDPAPTVLKNIVFHTPIIASSRESIRLNLLLENRENGYDFSIVRYVEETQAWYQHVTGQIIAGQNLSSIESPYSAQQGELLEAKSLSLNEHVVFGERSMCVQNIIVGENEAQAILNLDDKYLDDLQSMSLHPSLLDIATGFVNLYLVEDFHLPWLYNRLQVYAPLSAQLVSNARFEQTTDTLILDIIIRDAHSYNILARIDQFVMRKMDAIDTKLDYFKQAEAHQQVQHPAQSKNLPESVFQRNLSKGILPEEGITMLNQILNHQTPSRLIVSARTIKELHENIKETDTVSTQADSKPVHNNGESYRRSYSQYENAIASIWENVLGRQNIEIHDNFFNLGGTSLTLLQVMRQVHERFQLTLTINQYFHNQTVAELAQVIENELSQKNKA